MLRGLISDETWAQLQPWLGPLDRVLCAIAVVFGASVCFRVGLATTSPTAEAFHVDGADAILFRAVSERLARGADPYDRAALDAHFATEYLGGVLPTFDLPFAYPPWSLPAFLPYALGPDPRFGMMVWVLATSALFAAAGLALLHRTQGPGVRGWIALAAAASPSFGFNVFLGQTGALVAAIVAALLLAALHEGRRAEVVAGLLLAAAQLKPQYGLPLVLVFVVLGRWRTLGVALGAGAVAAGGVTLWLGPAIWPHWLERLAAPNLSLPYMVSWIKPGLLVMPEPVVLALRPWVFLLGLGAAGIVGFLLRRRLPLALAAALCIAMLASPNTHPYDGTLFFVLVPILAGRRLAMPAAIALTVTLFLPNHPRWPLALYLWPMLLGAVGMALWRVRTAQAPPGQADAG